MTIFIDTGAFLARYIEKDQHHKTAISKWNKLHKNKEKLLTSNFILNEMVTLLGRWVSADYALEKAHYIYNSGSFDILRPDETDEMLALDYFKKFGDHKIGFTDCLSFALMKRNKTQKVFTFDRHFVDAGYTKI